MQLLKPTIAYNTSKHKWVLCEKTKRWTMHWRYGLKIREQFTVSAFSLTVCQTYLHILINVDWNEYAWWFNTNRRYKWHCCLLLFLANISNTSSTNPSSYNLCNVSGIPERIAAKFVIRGFISLLASIYCRNLNHLQIC
jgi:hypothetical protein